MDEFEEGLSERKNREVSHKGTRRGIVQGSSDLVWS